MSRPRRRTLGVRGAGSDDWTLPTVLDLSNDGREVLAAGGELSLLQRSD